MKSFNSALAYHPGMVGSVTAQSSDRFHYTIKAGENKGYINLKRYLDGHLGVLSSFVDAENYATVLVTGHTEIYRPKELVEDLLDHVEEDPRFNHIFSTLCLLLDGRYKRHPLQVLAKRIFLDMPGALFVDDCLARQMEASEDVFVDTGEMCRVSAEFDHNKQPMIVIDMDHVVDNYKLIIYADGLHESDGLSTSVKVRHLMQGNFAVQDIDHEPIYRLDLSTIKFGRSFLDLMGKQVDTMRRMMDN